MGEALKKKEKIFEGLEPVLNPESIKLNTGLHSSTWGQRSVKLVREWNFLLFLTSKAQMWEQHDNLFIYQDNTIQAKDEMMLILIKRN